MAEEWKRLIEETSGLSEEELGKRLPPRGKRIPEMTLQERAAVAVYLFRRKKIPDADQLAPPELPDVAMPPTACVQPGGESESESSPAVRHGGPVTEEGKAVVRQNAFKHGLRATDKVFLDCLEESEREAFQRVRTAVWDDIQPVGALEELLTDKLVMNYWRLLRLYLVDRSTFRSCLKDWPNQRPSYGIGDMEKLGRYESCLERSFKTALHELQRLQAARRGQPVPLPVAVDVDVSGG